MNRPAPGSLLAGQLRNRGRAAAGEASAVTKPGAVRLTVTHLTHGVLAVARAVGRMWFDSPVTGPGARLGRSCDLGWPRMLCVPVCPRPSGGGKAPRNAAGPANAGPTTTYTSRPNPAQWPPNPSRNRNWSATTVATIAGRTAKTLLPAADTPGVVNTRPFRSDGLPRAEIACAVPPGHRPDGLSPLAVARAVPPGSRCARSQREALRGGLACPDLADVRRDFRDHLTDWWRIHVNYASWGGEGRPPRGTTEPTRARVCELAGRPGPDGEWRPMSVSTYKRCSRWWRARGYIAVARAGMDPHARALASWPAPMTTTSARSWCSACPAAANPPHLRPYRSRQ